ncbi:MAG: SIS domain-containing protein [Actinobacteria bacterium]|nr:SIS domain-containing protein [Actinomycetota bacterium]MBE3114618.1 SIS domain-containing protein [Actinomycetota bacterium]
MQRKGSNDTRIDRITDYLNDSARGISQLRQNNLKIIEIFELLKNNHNNHVFVCGNGGSSSSASHLVNDLLINGKIKIECLSDNISTVTAIANDCSYDDIYSIQLEYLAIPNDILIVFSGSGDSKNILKAIDKAIEKKMRIIAMIGTNGGNILKKYKDTVVIDYLIHIPIPMSNYEDASVIFIHLLMDLFKK